LPPGPRRFGAALDDLTADMTTIHKLSPERDGRDAGSAGVHIALNSELHDLAGAVVRARAVRACDLGTRALPIFREVRWSVRRKVIDVFDDLALDDAFAPQRIGPGSVLLSAPGVFVAGHGHDKGDYCSCVFKVWTDGRARADEVTARLQATAGPQHLRDQRFTIDWHFSAADGDLRSATFEEVAGDVLFDEAYPGLGRPVNDFVGGYLAAPDSVLILLGPPGGGKTRLVREILAAISRRKGENAEIMYTTDKRALASDSMFVQFVIGSHDAFVIEDSDLLLKARTSGNEDMHRFLGIADGIARAQSRKIIFTTNLPNVTDIDPALIRPGRCYAVKQIRSLMPDEAKRLIARIVGGDAVRAARAEAALFGEVARSYSVAQIYRACAT
jgi:AAA domain (dynein-related subfamily)